jgi:hypothetical protein
MLVEATRAPAAR